MRFRSESSGTPARLPPPDARLQPRPRAAEAQVQVVAVCVRPGGEALAPPLPVVARGVALHAPPAGPPGAAVPDDLLDSHAPGQGMEVAGRVGSEEPLD